MLMGGCTSGRRPFTPLPPLSPRLRWCARPPPAMRPPSAPAQLGRGLPAASCPLRRHGPRGLAIPRWRSWRPLPLSTWPSLPLRLPPGPAARPSPSRRRLLLHAAANVLSVACAYSSFVAVPSANAATVRKGCSTLGSALLGLCLESRPLSGYDWFGLLGSTLGLLIMVVPDLLSLDPSTRLADAFGYALACLGGVALALGLAIFRALDFPAKLSTAAFAFGALGGLVCAPAMFLLQEPVLPAEPLTWSCTVAVGVLAVASFLCASHAVTLAHPALVCAVLHSEVVVTLAVQYYVLREAVTPFDVMGAGVILGSISIIAAQNVSCHLRDEEGEEG
uniref:EamA domain-containing protein n=1 Tax=Chelonoidis abingdonii TaxID=106734 RepID=A0A8C0H8X0_CHEAB